MKIHSVVFGVVTPLKSEGHDLDVAGYDSKCFRVPFHSAVCFFVICTRQNTCSRGVNKYSDIILVYVRAS